MTVFAPQRCAMSARRTPKYPLRQTMAVSPRSITLTQAVSIAPVPVAEIGIVTRFAGVEHLPEHLAHLVHDLEEDGIEVSYHGLRHGTQNARVHGAGSSAQQQTVRRFKFVSI